MRSRVALGLLLILLLANAKSLGRMVGVGKQKAANLFEPTDTTAWLWAQIQLKSPAAIKVYIFRLRLADWLACWFIGILGGACHFICDAAAARWRDYRCCCWCYHCLANEQTIKDSFNFSSSSLSFFLSGWLKQSSLLGKVFFVLVAKGA